MVPESAARSVPWSSATATYMAMMIAAGPLMVIDVETAPRSIPSNSAAMSSRVSMATPALPTSPSDSGSSESQPMSVGMSNAVERPVPPESRSWRKRWLVSAAEPNPANIRIVQGLARYIEP